LKYSYTYRLDLRRRPSISDGQPAGRASDGRIRTPPPSSVVHNIRVGHSTPTAVLRGNRLSRPVLLKNSPPRTVRYGGGSSEVADRVVSADV
ncbi:hypothetical protein Dimus_028895, partial [Dionaea muscipula]